MNDNNKDPGPSEDIMKPCKEEAEGRKRPEQTEIKVTTIPNEENLPQQVISDTKPITCGENAVHLKVTAETDTVEPRLTAGVKFKWPAQTVNTSQQIGGALPLLKEKPSKHTQTFVLKKVSRNAKLYRLPGAQYKIKPVFARRPKRNFSCPTIYLGAPFLTNPEDLMEGEEQKEIDDMPIKPSLPEKPSTVLLEKQLVDCSAAVDKDLYDIATVKDGFLSSNTDAACSTSASVDPTLSLTVDSAMQNLYHYGLSMVVSRHNARRDDMASAWSLPSSHQMSPASILPARTQGNMGPVSEYRIVPSKMVTVKPQVIKTAANLPIQPVYSVWQGQYMPTNKPKLVISSSARSARSIAPQPAMVKVMSSNPCTISSVGVQKPKSVAIDAKGITAPASLSSLGKALPQSATAQTFKGPLPHPPTITITASSANSGVRKVVYPTAQKVSGASSVPPANSLIAVNIQVPQQLKQRNLQNIPIRMVSLPLTADIPKKVVHLKAVPKPGTNQTVETTQRLQPSNSNHLLSLLPNGIKAKKQDTGNETHVTQGTKRKLEDNPATNEEPAFFKRSRAGVEVQFADGVRHQITKLSEMTYQDDEPVKSWSELKKGTEVAALWTDGLVYDATVVRCYFPTKVQQMQPVVKLEKLQPEASPKNLQHKKKNSQTKIMCFSCQSVFSKIGAFRKHQRLKCQSHGINVAHPDIKSNIIIDNSLTASEKAKQNVPSTVEKYSSDDGNVPQSGRKKRKSVAMNSELKTVKIQPPKAKIKSDDLRPPSPASQSKEWTHPSLADGRLVFRVGTKFLHRWQLPDGSSKWYQGKITKIFSPDAGKETEFEVLYKGEEDQGPYTVKLYEDYPTDIRIMGH